MPLPELWLLLAWVKFESQKRDTDPQAILDYLRNALHKKVLEDYDQEHMLRRLSVNNHMKGSCRAIRCS